MYLINMQLKLSITYWKLTIIFDLWFTWLLNLLEIKMHPKLR